MADPKQVTRFLAQTIDNVPIDSIEPHPDNPNEGDVGAISESVDALDGAFYNIVFVQKSSGRIIAGEHRWRTLKARGSDVAPVVFLDVTDEQALRIMIGDNEIPRRRSRAREDLLGQLLVDLAQQSDAGLLGTGFDDADLDLLLAQAVAPHAFDPNAEWDGMPNFVQHELNSKYRVTVHFRDEADRDSFFTLIERPTRTSMWWPKDDEHVGSNVGAQYVEETTGE